MKRFYLVVLLLSLCLGAFSQEITVRFTGQLNGTSYCRLDSVAVTNLTRDWTETFEYPDTIIVPGGTVGTNLNIAATQGLGQNIPNPFDCETRVELSVSQRENVRMQLLDASGKQYAEYSGLLDAGVHTFDISAAAPLTYILNAVVGDKSYSIRMVNMGSGCGCSIKYAGISGSITAKLTSANEFQNGDNMRYVGYTTIEGEVVASTAVEQAQTISEVITLNFTHCINTFGTDIQSVCESYTWIDGVTYTESTTEPTFTLTNAAGCDSIVTLNLTINHSSTGIDEQTACDSYEWIDGVTYTESTNEPTFILTNATGCDSIVTLNLTISHNSGIDTQTACESYTWIDGVTYTESTNEPTFTLTNAAGCDSVVTLHLTIACLPIVRTNSATDITVDRATIYGNVISDGGAAVTVRGFLYGTSENNLTEDVQSGNGTGSFTANLTDLTSGTIYYYKAYATNSEGTAYGEVLSFTTLSTTGTQNGHDWVDLGLPSGARWATCNVGADTPEGYGNYYAWGETTTKEYFSESNYLFYIIYDSQLEVTAYCGNPEYCNQGLDNLTTLQSVDDAATANWGRGWRMPTYDELYELIINCTKTWTTQNGVSGCLLTGPNGNSIFLPSLFEDVDDSYYSFYWSSSLAGTLTAYLLYIYQYENDFDVHVDSDTRAEGYFVRAICPTGGNITIVMPIVTTGSAYFSANSASIYGNVSYNGGADVTDRGFIYGTNSDNLMQTVQCGSGTGDFNTTLNDLISGTTYYYRAYATNSAGTAYGEVLSFTTRSLPTVQTNAATSITGIGATLSGNVISDGGSTVTSRGFKYGTDANNLTRTVPGGNGTGSFTADLTSLTSSTTYYYKAYAYNSVGRAYGEVMSFTTISVPAPTVQTNAATSITATGATLSGNVTSDGGADVTSRGFMYGTDASNLTQTIQSGSGTGSFTKALTGLTYNTTYYYKAFASNSAGGLAYGEVMSFTTLSVPTVQTNAATNITGDGATLSGNVTSDGGANVTTRGFMYGTDSSNLNLTVQSGSGTGSFTANLTGLTYSTTYYYKAFATNRAGTAYGEVMSFTTNIDALTVQTDAATNVTATGATLNGRITSTGGEAITDRGFMYGTDANSLTQTVQSSSSNDNYRKVITGLASFTTYYYKAYATNREGTSYGEVMSFTTLCFPTVQTNAATNIIADGATLFGNVTSADGATITARGFQYGTNESNLTRTIQSGSGMGSFLANLTSLTYGTTYYYKAYATNSAGTAYGEVLSFTTNSSANAPTVRTNAATSITAASATLSGSIISNGGATINDRGFVYGTDANNLSQTVQSDSGNGNFTESIIGLASGTTYYYKAYATNREGTSYGDIMSFTTETTGTLNGHDWVDLGLPSGTRWATCNVGASAPENRGNYYAWGEISTKLDVQYTQDYYTYSANPTTLPSNKDAATANWGEGWRMPTKVEMNELLNNCTIHCVYQNGKYGTLFTGPNGNSIFMPNSGYLNDGEHISLGVIACYWTSSLYESYPFNAWYLYVQHLDSYGMGDMCRAYGMQVRPVCVSNN